MIAAVRNHRAWVGCCSAAASSRSIFSRST
jgi:hypothetical protein